MSASGAASICLGLTSGNAVVSASGACGAGASITLTSPATSLIISGSPGSTLTADVSTTYLNTLYSQLAASNTFTAGAIQTFTPSSTAPGSVIVPGSVPSAILSYAGGQFVTATGIQGEGDGTNINYFARFIGSGTTAPAAPTNNHLAGLTSAYGIIDLAYPSACTGGQFSQGLSYSSGLSNNCGTPAGGGNVSNTGTPTNGQIAVWTNSTTIEGLTNLTLPGTLTAASLSTSGTIAGSICATSAGLILYEVGVNCESGGSSAFPQTVSGTTTSGGIPYFSNTTTLTSSGLLATNALMVGGGSGGSPTTGNGDFTYATHTLTIGTAGILTFTGSGVNNANEINGATIPASAAPVCSNSSSQIVNCTVTGTGTTVVVQSSPNILGTLTLGTAGSATGLETFANTTGAGTFTIGSSPSTTSNTMLGPTAAIANGHLIYCATSSTTCTLTDSGVAYNGILRVYPL